MQISFFFFWFKDLHILFVVNHHVSSRLSLSQHCSTHPGKKLKHSVWNLSHVVSCAGMAYLFHLSKPKDFS